MKIFVSIITVILLMPILFPSMLQIVKGDTQPWYIISIVALWLIHGRKIIKTNPITIMFGVAFIAIIIVNYIMYNEFNASKTIGFIVFYAAILLFPTNIFIQYKKHILITYLLVNSAAVAMYYKNPQLLHRLFSDRTPVVAQSLLFTRSLQLAYPEPSYAAKYAVGLAVIYVMLNNRMSKTSTILLLCSLATCSATGVVAFSVVIMAYFPILSALIVLPLFLLTTISNSIFEYVGNMFPGRMGWIISELQYCSFSQAYQIVSSTDESFLQRSYWFTTQLNRFRQSPILGRPLDDQNCGLVLLLAGFGVVGLMFLFYTVAKILSKKAWSYNTKCIVLSYMALIFMADSIYLPTVAAILSIVLSGINLDKHQKTIGKE